MCEWKEQSANRRDERNVKFPEKLIPLCRRIKRKANKKPFKLMCKGKENSKWKWSKEPSCWSRYRTLKDAEQALAQYQNQRWRKENIIMWIESPTEEG